MDVIGMYRQLMTYYNVDSIMGLVDAQHEHIVNLQQKLVEARIPKVYLRTQVRE